MPLVSIVALFYNQCEYVDKSVKSLLEQTYGNCEIILSDDCSTDGTGARLKQLVADYIGPHKVVVNINEKNLGIGNHFKNVFAMCRGEWIVTCGGDDLLEADRVAHVIKYANKYPNVVAIGCSSSEIDECGNIICKKPLVDKPLIYTRYTSGDFSWELAPRRCAPMCFIAGALAAWHRKVIDVATFPENVLAEDVVLSLRAALLGDMLFIPELDVKRRIGGISLKGHRSKTRSARREHRRTGAVMCFRSEFAVLKECDSYPFKVSDEFRKKIWTDSALALLKCMDLPLSEMPVYSSAFRRALEVQGLVRSLEMAFSAGRLMKFLIAILTTAVRKYEDKLIIRVDGGICSQIAFVALGLDLANMGNKVLFDLTWFNDSGKDADGKFVRNWDMPKAFPNLDIPLCDFDTIVKYKKKYSQRGSDITTFKAPLYVGGYPNRMPSLMKLRAFLRDRFSPKLDERRAALVHEVEIGPSCAVHVRRGDLSKTNYAYGEPTSICYYKRATAIVKGLAPDVRFYFFSDEPQWVLEELIPNIGITNYTIVSQDNESDKGYMDLFLISKADYIVSSIGSLGVYGAIFSQKCKALLMSKYDKDVFNGLENVICVNGDKSYQYSDVTVKKHGVFKPLYSLWKTIGRIIGAPSIRIAG